MIRRLITFTCLLVAVFAQTGCWYALAGRAAAKRIESGDGPVGEMVNQMADGSTDTNGGKTSATTSSATAGGNY